MGFLRQVIEKTEKRQGGGTWRSAAAESVLKDAGTHILRAYIDKQQVTVAEWVVLSPILDIFDR